MNMQFKYKCLFFLSPLVFLLDQFTKYLIIKDIALGEKITIIDGYFDIVHYTNNGAAFGMLSNLSDNLRVPFFYAISAIALVLIIFYIYKLQAVERTMALALSLVVGGILGNGLDRIRLGSVTDFLSVHIGDKVLWGVRLEWPAFNIADSAITVAMFLLIISFFKDNK